MNMLSATPRAKTWAAAAAAASELNVKLLAVVDEEGLKAAAESPVQEGHENQENYRWTCFLLLREVLKGHGHKNLLRGKALHKALAANGFDRETMLGNCLIELYSKRELIEDARKVFDKIAEKNAVSWNAMLSAYAQNGHPHQAMRLYREMQQHGFFADKYTFCVVVGICTALRDPTEGRRIHAHLAADELDSDVVLETALLNMYGKCNLLLEARLIFDEMYEKNLVSWNAMIAAYAQHGHGQEALVLYQRMALEGFRPEKSTFISALDACASAGDVSQGGLVHAQIVASAQYDLVLATALMNMYGKVGALHEATRMFKLIPKKDVVTWNVLIAANAQHRHCTEAIDLFREMQLEGVKPSKLTLVSAVDAFATAGDVVQGRTIHHLVEESGLDKDVAVGNTLIKLYGKCRSLSEAREVFDNMEQKDLVSWNAMISAYAQAGHGREALELFWKMGMEGLGLSDRVTFVSSLDACGEIGSVAAGEAIHASVVSVGLENDIVVGNALINMYSKCGSVKNAVDVFEGMQRKNAVSWNVVIGACTRHGLHQRARQFVKRMDLEGVKTDKVTFLSILDACNGVSGLLEGKLIHARLVENGLDMDEIVGKTLVAMFGKCGSTTDSRAAFDAIINKTVVSWNAILRAFCYNGAFKEAVRLHWRMGSEGVNSDKMTFTILLDACMEIGDLTEGRRIYEESREADVQTDPAVGKALVTMYEKLSNLPGAI